MENKKQELISLLDQMDEDYLDWLLYLIKLRPIRKEEKAKYTIDPNAKDIWNKVCNLIAREITEVSYNTWIKDITPIGIHENLFKLGIKNEFTKGILEARYSALFKTALFYITDIKYEIEYYII